MSKMSLMCTKDKRWRCIQVHSFTNSIPRRAWGQFGVSPWVYAKLNLSRRVCLGLLGSHTWGCIPRKEVGCVGTCGRRKNLPWGTLPSSGKGWSKCAVWGLHYDYPDLAPRLSLWWTRVFQICYDKVICQDIPHNLELPWGRKAVDKVIPDALICLVIVIHAQQCKEASELHKAYLTQT